VTGTLARAWPSVRQDTLGNSGFFQRFTKPVAVIASAGGLLRFFESRGDPKKSSVLQRRGTHFQRRQRSDAHASLSFNRERQEADVSAVPPWMLNGLAPLWPQAVQRTQRVACRSIPQRPNEYQRKFARARGFGTTATKATRSSLS
jgi:hypothetical protein